MKILTILLAPFLLLLSSNYSLAQSTWKKFFNPPNTRSFADDLVETYDKGFLIGGIFRVPLLDQGWIIKTDINGNKLYEIHVGDGSKATTIMCLNKTSDGGFIVGGYFNPVGQIMNSYVMKFNTCGEKEWCTMIAQPGEFIQTLIDDDIYELPDGSYIAHRTMASFNSNDDRESLIKFKHDGTIEWINAYTHDSSMMIKNEMGLSLTLTSDTCFLITGLNDYQIEPNLYSTRPYWYKVDQSGNLLWITTWVTPLHSGWGEANSSFEGIEGQSYYSAGKYGSPLPQSFIYKINKFGDTLQKFRIIDDSLAQGGSAHDLLFLNDTSLITTTQFGRNTTDNWWSINRSDTLGNIITQIKDEELIVFLRIIKTFDDKILALGCTVLNYPSYPEMLGLYKFNSLLEYDSIYTIPFSYDSLCAHQILSYSVDMPGDCIEVSLPETPPSYTLTKLSIYPNPSSDFVTIEIPEFISSENKYNEFQEIKYQAISDDISLKVIDIEGKLIQNVNISSGTRNYCLEVSKWNPGMYFFQLIHKEQRIAEAKFVKF